MCVRVHVWRVLRVAVTSNIRVRVTFMLLVAPARLYSNGRTSSFRTLSRPWAKENSGITWGGRGGEGGACVYVSVSVYVAVNVCVCVCVCACMRC